MDRLPQWAAVLVVLAVMIALGYPVALLFGLPLAQRDMNDLRKWRQATVRALPPVELPDEPTDTLVFADHPDPAVLVRNGAPARLGTAAPDPAASGAAVRAEAIDAEAIDAETVASAPGEAGAEAGADAGEAAVAAVRLADRVTAEDLIAWTADFEPLGGGVYRLGAPLPDAQHGPPAVYARDRWLREEAVRAHERPDGQRVSFTFDVADGPVLVNGEARTQGEEYESDGETVVFATPPAFGSDVLRVSGDYAVLDADTGTILIAADLAPGTDLRAGADAVRLAERLVGEIDGRNRRFRLARTPVVENDGARRIVLDDRVLSAQDERPEERVDGTRSDFTFASATGIVVLDGRVLEEGRDYARDGAVVRLAWAPARNARLRQHVDYTLADASTGEVLLAEPPAEGSVLWAQQYAYYREPGCGATMLECFYALPQHPVPFPHWIAQRVGPFLAKYSLSDPRNVVRATAYTTLGTLYALLLGAAVGVLLAVVFVLFRPVERALLPWVIASQTVPIIALVPVMLLVLGNFGITVQTSLLPTALIGAYIAFFPVVVSTVKGLRSVDPLALDLMRSYAATPWEVFRKVRFPAAVPFFFTSLKLGTAAALVGALVAETESNNRRGLGFQILGQVQSGNVADVWILLILSGLLGIGLVAVVGLIERILAPWRRA